jgi:hypothetical protein
MLPGFENSSEDRGTADLPRVDVRFNPTELPPGFVGLKDLGDFVSALQLYVVRQRVVQSSEPEYAIDLAPEQTLLVVPETGSVIAKVIPYIATLPHLYEGIKPILVVLQRDTWKLGQAFLWTGEQVLGGGLHAIGELVTRKFFDERRAHERAPVQPPDSQSSPTADPNSTSPDGDYQLLRETAAILASAIEELGSVTAGRTSPSDRVLQDEHARRAIKNMGTASSRDYLKGGSINLDIPVAVLQTYDVRVSLQPRFDQYTRPTVTDLLNQAQSQSQERISVIAAADRPAALPWAQRAPVAGTVRGEPNYTTQHFILTHPLIGEIKCSFSSDLTEQVSRIARPDKQVLVEGLVHQAVGNQPPYMEIRTIQPVS